MCNEPQDPYEPRQVRNFAPSSQAEKESAHTARLPIIDGTKDQLRH
jgi:hypothetical protein